MGLTSSPATEAIMGVLPAEKAGVGSAVNDATRLLGGTFGVAIMGSVYGSLFASKLSSGLPDRLPAAITQTAHSSIGAALAVAHRLAVSGHPALARTVHAAAGSAFFSGFHAADFVAVGIAAVGAVMALLWLPSHPVLPPAGPLGERGSEADPDHDHHHGREPAGQMPTPATVGS
jgi:hypothetical protein